MIQGLTALIKREKTVLDGLLIREPLGVRVPKNKNKVTLLDNLILLVEAAGKRGRNS